MDKFKLQKVPATIFYVPDFVTEEEEEMLMRNVYAAPKPKWTQLSNRRLQNWGGLPHPKGMVAELLPEWLQRICTRISDCGVFSDATQKPNHVLVNEYLPGQGIMPHTDGSLYYPTVTTVTLGCHSVLDFYNPLESDVSTVESCSNENNCCLPTDDTYTAECEMTSSSLDARRFASILLMPRSLNVVKDDMYSKYLHGIREVTSDVIDESFANLDTITATASSVPLSVGTQLHRSKPRISLTIRVVPKVLQNKILFGKR